MPARKTWQSLKATITGQFQALTHPLSLPDAPQRTVPYDGMRGLVQNFRYDSLAGFIIFLIAMPLSLGIAMASGLPPVAGLISAAVGGILVSQISGSHVTINGPAAGLIVVVVGAVDALGGGNEGYRNTLAAIVVSGLTLFALGRLKCGELGKFFPASVVHGMLASIGLIIILKQLPVMLGVQLKVREPFEIVMHLPHVFTHLNPYVALIGIVSLLILIVHPKLPLAALKKIPAPIMVIAAGILMSVLFQMSESHDYTFFKQVFSINPGKMLVQVPTDFSKLLTFPDFGALRMPRFWPAVFSITLVQGIETVLSCAAVDKLDPFKRKSNLSKDLSAVGFGSAVSGAIGGLPMIAEIVRSTANIASGARTRYANFFHGLFLLVCVATCAALLNRIPLAALAALLVFTGYRLASPRHFKEMHEIGAEQSLIFVSTILITLATDLLIGVFSGVAIKLFLHVLRGVKPVELFRGAVDVQDGGENDTYISPRGACVFSNYLTLKHALDSLQPGRNVTIQFDKTTFLDHTVMEHLDDFRTDYEHLGGKVGFIGLDRLKCISDHPQCSRRLERQRL